MSYQIVIRKQAKKMLQKLDRTRRNQIAEKIELLGDNPNNPNLDIKPLQGTLYFRLRVGQWRVIYDRDDNIKIIAVEKIKPRGDAYK